MGGDYVHLVILGQKMGQVLKQEVEQRADNIEVSCYASISEFIKAMTFRAIPQEELYRMWVCEDILNKDRDIDVTTVVKLYQYLDSEYRDTKVITISKDDYAHGVFGEVFISPLQLNVCLSRISGVVLQSMLSKSLDVVAKKCGVKPTTKKVAKAIKTSDKKDKSKGVVKEPVKLTKKTKESKPKERHSLFGRKSKKSSIQQEENISENIVGGIVGAHGAFIDELINDEIEESVDEADKLVSDTTEEKRDGVAEDIGEFTVATEVLEKNVDEELSGVRESEKISVYREKESNNQLEEHIFDDKGVDGVPDIGSDILGLMINGVSEDSSEVSGKEEVCEGTVPEEENSYAWNISEDAKFDIDSKPTGLEDLKESIYSLAVNFSKGDNIALDVSVPEIDLLKVADGYSKATEKVIERVIEKKVVVDGGGYRNTTEKILATGLGVLLVTGDRRSGKTEVVHRLAQKYCRKTRVLVVDFAQGLSGLAIKFGLDKILNFEEHRQCGLARYKGDVSVEYLIVEGGDVDYPMLLNIGDKLKDGDIEPCLERLVVKTKFPLIIVDIPIEYLQFAERLLSSRNLGVLMCIEGNITGVINTGVKLDDVKLDSVADGVLQDKVLYCKTRGSSELKHMFGVVKRYIDMNNWFDANNVIDIFGGKDKK